MRKEGDTFNFQVRPVHETQPDARSNMKKGDPPQRACINLAKEEPEWEILLRDMPHGERGPCKRKLEIAAGTRFNEEAQPAGVGAAAWEVTESEGEPNEEEYAHVSPPGEEAESAVKGQEGVTEAPQASGISE
ncbi:hypothetical protein KIPB_010174 [Kipferlia bialata]|uniref:Uncharacterized protein n=1 Tax=Kipferlia bialata TaxID=797122 RepID=A0A9K3GM61_9EUKA|nr:hypothetical protein KIPB_010174 [Kipferlia bialata]|eukprot:g10174.t1